LADKPCNFSNFYHDLSWEPDVSGDCDDELSQYRLFFSETGQENTFEQIGTFSASILRTRIEGLSSLKGCYYLVAVDRSGNVSDPSEIVCIDNCPNYELPNVFTPNSDGVNDTFRAFDNPFEKCPRFVEAVEIKIYNRWGVQVFEYNSRTSAEGSIYINWDGHDQNGKELPAGTYFYSGTVQFDTLDEGIREQKLKGNIQIIR